MPTGAYNKGRKVMSPLVSQKQSKKPPGSVSTEGLPVCWGSVLAVHEELFVKPLANIVSDYTCCDGQKESNQNAH